MVILSTPSSTCSLDGNGWPGCLPSGSLSGKIAFMGRGECTFASKVANAANAGAVAVLVYDNVPGESPITMGGLDTTSIPAVMISYSNGLLLQSFVSANAGTTVSIGLSTEVVLTPTLPDELTSFSSRGPSPDFAIKPDLVAVGENVYSATQTNFPGQGQYDASGFTTGSGTSFSAPMVSGAASHRSDG
jgi:subtilisin family serine protease